MRVTGIHPGTAQSLDIEIEDGIIQRVGQAAGPVECFISPGWIDLQVNGFAGVDYNDPQTSTEEIARSIEVQRSTGVARIYPTVITGSFADMSGSLHNLAAARNSLSEGGAMLGFHVEGPWISPHDGPRGAHPVDHVRAPSIEEFNRLQDAAEGNIRLLTLSPEYLESAEVIEYMAREGVVVSIGHTNASGAQIADAIAAGATMSTHLGNGAHASLPRHENYIMNQMAADSLFAGLIIDGIHLPTSFVKVALRAKGLALSFLVTDAVAPAHCPPGIYQIGEQQVELLPEQRVELTSSRRLAGSALSMDRGVETVMRMTGISLFEATQLATTNPAKAMGLSDRSCYLEAGQAADFTLFQVEDDGGLTVKQTLACAA